MGKIFIIKLIKVKFKIWRVTFLKSFFTIKKAGMDFHARDDLPSDHWDEIELVVYKVAVG